jgi:Bacterial capsule synthesis protein PGA_cap
MHLPQFVQMFPHPFMHPWHAGTHIAKRFLFVCLLSVGSTPTHGPTRKRKYHGLPTKQSKRPTPNRQQTDAQRMGASRQGGKEKRERKRKKKDKIDHEFIDRSIDQKGPAGMGVLGFSMALLAVLLFPAGGQSKVVRVTLTGDVNLNPILPPGEKKNYSFVWGDTLPFLRGNVDQGHLLAVNHESTLAEVPNNDPATIQFEDPLDYVPTYGPEGANVGFMSVANNHQYDFHLAGLERSLMEMQKHGIAYGGVGKSAAEVMSPRVVDVSGLKVAFFTIVVDECYRWPNGSLYLDGCTCGSNAGPPPPYQCYMANKTMPGLWYHWQITDGLIKTVREVVHAYRVAHPEQLVSIPVISCIDAVCAHAFFLYLFSFSSLRS